MKKKALFLDRDGVINVDKGYVSKIEDFEFENGVIEALKILGKEYLLFIVTNQSGISRGLYTIENYYNLTEYMLKIFSLEGIKIEKIKFCPHMLNGKIKKYSIKCSCRKPNPGMILEILNEYDIDRENSWMIGDKDSDIKTGKNTNLKTALIESNKYETEATPNMKISNLLEFANKILYSNKKTL